jgi:hypothetical protein
MTAMGLREERRSKRFRNQDELEGRITLFLAGSFLLFPACWVVSSGVDASHWFALTLVLLLGLYAAFLVVVSLFGTVELLNRVGNSTGNHEVLFIFFLVSFPIAWIIRRLKK